MDAPEPVQKAPARKHAASRTGKQQGKKRAKTSPKAKRRRAKTDKRRREKSRSASASSSGSSHESSSSSDESTSSDSESPASTGSKPPGRRVKDDKWPILNDTWPIETRPAYLRDREYVNRQSWRTLHALQDRYEKEAERRGFGAAIFGKDQKLKKVKFSKKADDGYTKLHPARWLRLPMAPPDKYWKRVPRAHEQRFRHLHLAHYGAKSQINEKIILGMHDRQVRELVLTFAEKQFS